MSRERYIVRKRADGRGVDLIPWNAAAVEREGSKGPIVVRDIEPYRSTETGETIQGRRQHRDHLRAHGMVEIGNERLPDRKPIEAPPVRDDIRRSLEQMGGLDPTPRTREGWRDMIEKGRGRDVAE